MLGFEAVSRGASCAVLVEQDPQLCRQLQENIDHFTADGITVVNANALDWLRQNKEHFDLV